MNPQTQVKLGMATCACYPTTVEVARIGRLCGTAGCQPSSRSNESHLRSTGWKTVMEQDILHPSVTSTYTHLKQSY